MIQIESVTIREVRGIRDLTIEPNRKNFLVSGPNGSGKSGVVDAIQLSVSHFLGTVSRCGVGSYDLKKN